MFGHLNLPALSGPAVIIDKLHQIRVYRPKLCHSIRDDENYGDSVSIETQRTILQQYAKEQGLHVVGEYVDDGWSGTNFDARIFSA